MTYSSGPGTVEITMDDGSIVHAAVRAGSRPPRGTRGAVASAVTHSLGEVRRTVRAVGRWPARRPARRATRTGSRWSSA
ncbi:hypothetical protein [Kitasatospora fiedleri]|uniref:hypothetical protein n=1 Tax=Kitasatospora fiedleri TaxID=2991545 RepID=UPI00249BE33D|nr:hypothetical protein [Kitasatospora fiedleri]